MTGFWAHFVVVALVDVGVDLGDIYTTAIHVRKMILKIVFYATALLFLLLICTPRPIRVTTRTIAFLVGNPELNLHLPLAYWGADPIYSIFWF